MLPLPLDPRQITFEACCGKHICSGCIRAMDEREGDDSLCSFCRTPCAESEEEIIERLEKLMEKDHAEAVFALAGYYVHGRMGMPQDQARANALYLKAGELGCAGAYHNLGNNYRLGTGVEVDEEKAKHYYKLAAMNGSVEARHNLGCVEEDAGDPRRACKHFVLAARAGYKQSLDAVKEWYIYGDVKKEEYANTLRAYHERQLEMKSDMRDKALAARNERMVLVEH